MPLSGVFIACVYKNHKLAHNQVKGARLMTKPLTKREINLYRRVYWVSTLIWIGGILFYFFLSDRAFSANYFEVCLFAINTAIAYSVGKALQTGTRFIYGIPWLLEDGTEQKTETPSQ